MRYLARPPSGIARLHVERLSDWVLGKFQGTLLILMTAVGLLLLITCGNVATLLLAQASARRHEMAVRMSAGAGPGRLLRQLLTESVLLSAAGGALGVLFAWQGVPAIIAVLPEYSVPHEAVIDVNGTVVLFTFAVSVITGILFGMAPALQLRKPEVREAMQWTAVRRVCSQPRRNHGDAPVDRWNTVFERPGAPSRFALVGMVGDEYFSTLRIPLLRGRVFSRHAGTAANDSSSPVAKGRLILGGARSGIVCLHYAVN
jgi:hypothetical protein